MLCVWTRQFTISTYKIGWNVPALCLTHGHSQSTARLIMVVCFPHIPVGDMCYLRSYWRGCLILALFASPQLGCFLLCHKSSLLVLLKLPKQARISRLPFHVRVSQESRGIPSPGGNGSFSSSSLHRPQAWVLQRGAVKQVSRGHQALLS